MRMRSLFRRSEIVCPVVALGACLMTMHAAMAQYTVHNLVSDQAGAADHLDPHLTNAWGVVFNPAANGFVWVSSNHGGSSTLYDGLGNPQTLVVDIPTPGEPTGGSPTGIVFSGGANFVVNNGSGQSGPARFLWATEDGTIAGWNPTVGSPPTPSTHAFVAVNQSAAGAIYKGLALSTAASVGGGRLFATDFHNGRVDMFDGAFAQVVAPGSFSDPNLPAGYAPFNSKIINGEVFVTYALQDADAEDDVPGAGHGFIDRFDLAGNLLSRFASEGVLNSPWGLAVAPANFGEFSGDLLVGNFGDGRINAFDPLTGVFQGSISDAAGNPVSIEGLWGIEFGNGANNQPTNTLFFAAGPDDETHGLYGRVDVPAPSVLACAAAALVCSSRRRRRTS